MADGHTLYKHVGKTDEQLAQRPRDQQGNGPTAAWPHGKPIPGSSSSFSSYRRLVWAQGIRPVIARRGVAHGSGLGVHRWVVERTIAWFHGFRRLRVRWERRGDIHEAFLDLATCLITHRSNAFVRTSEPQPGG